MCGPVSPSGQWTRALTIAQLHAGYGQVGVQTLILVLSRYSTYFKQPSRLGHLGGMTPSANTHDRAQTLAQSIYCASITHCSSALSAKHARLVEGATFVPPVARAPLFFLFPTH